MTEGSIPWDHGKGGHASAGGLFSSPYDSAEWAQFWSLVHASDDSIGYVLPDVDNNLEVLDNNPDAMNVIVKSGAAFVHGRLYRSTAQETLTIAAADGSNPRLDRVVLRVTTTTGIQTVILAVLTGTPAATPSLPALTQNATTWEVPLAYVWVATGAVTIAATEVHDERIFMHTAKHEPNYGAIENAIQNSEYIAVTTQAATHPPAKWRTAQGTPTFAFAAPPTQMARGREMQITAGASPTIIEQVVHVKPSTHYVFKCLFNVTAGDVGQFVLQTRATPTGSTLTEYIRTLRRTGAWIEETIHFVTDATADWLGIRLVVVTSTDIVKFGQALLARGYDPGPFREIHETIMFDIQRLTDPDFPITTTGTTTIDLVTDFRAIALDNPLRAVCVFATLSYGSTGSGEHQANVQSMASQEYVKARLYATNELMDVQGWIPLETHQQQFKVALGVTGTGTQVDMQIVGIQT